MTVHGTGLPANAALRVVWHTERGRWILAGAQHDVFKGRRFTPVTRALASAATDANGAFTATFHVPSGFGFSHDVTVQRGGKTLDRDVFDVTPQITVAPRSGPVGTPIRVTMRGQGYQPYRNSWMLSYDNHFTGWLSSVTTDGTAVAVIPATGAAGTHVLSVSFGPFQFPYLNPVKAPAAERFKFTVTAGAPVLPPAATTQGLESVGDPPPGGNGPALWVDPTQATVGTPAVLHARGLTPGQDVGFRWLSVAGSHVGSQGWKATSRNLGSAKASADGSVTLPFTVPDDVGGPHSIVVGGGGTAGQSLSTALTIAPSVQPLSPDSGPAGTLFTLRLKGGGWTDTSNIYTVVYDDAYTGYACAFSTHGDITIRMPATGTPGWHFIDLYPAIYTGTDAPGLYDFRVPQLTYAQDHPGERLPAFHFAFRVTG